MGLDAEGNEAYAELCADIILSGSADDPLYLRIQKFHRNKISAYVASGGKEEEYVWNLRKKYVAQIMVPSNRLMYTLDPKGTRKRDRVIKDSGRISVITTPFSSSTSQLRRPLSIRGIFRNTWR